MATVRGVVLTARDANEVRVARETFIIGSSAQADLRIPGVSIDPEHVVLTLTREGARLHAPRGVWIGTVRLNDAVLTADTMLRIGDTLLSLRFNGALELEAPEIATFGDAIAVSLPMRRAFELLERTARSNASIVLEGEDGVGKELLARNVHARSERRDGPFVVFAGAADRDLESALELARGGTLFIDDVDTMRLDVQGRLLRAIEHGSLGLRLIAASTRDLESAVRAGALRRDLFYRLAIARVRVPALRARVDDIIPLARHFLRQIRADESAVLPSDYAALLTVQPWPGNVRALRATIERFALFGDRELGSDAPLLADDDLARLPFHEAKRIALERFERTYVPMVLARAGGIVSRAAELAEVARPSFYRMLDRLQQTRH